MNYSPKQTPKARRLALLFLLTGLVLMMLAGVLPYGSVIQIVGLALIVVGIQLTVRWVLPEFRYLLNDRDDGASELIIFKKTGKNEIKVAHVSLSAIVEIFKYKEKKADSDNRYNYCRNLTDDAHVLLMRDGEKTVEIIFEPDGEFLRAVRDRMGVGGGDMKFVM